LPMCTLLKVITDIAGIFQQTDLECHRFFIQVTSATEDKV